MSAIAGIVGLSSQVPAAALCRTMLDAQAPYGGDSVDLADDGDAAFGRSLRCLLPEDRFDRQPLSGAGGRLRLVADLRLDNREALLAELGGSARDAAGMSDSDILLRAWERWGDSAPGRLLGDFAIAAWDAGERRLTLARDATGQRPLHYVAEKGFAAFASMPQALCRLPGRACEPDESSLAAFVADLPIEGHRSFFAGIRRVEPGTLVVLDGAGARLTDWWNPAPRPLSLPTAEAYGEALREEIDRAVRRRLRRARGGVAAHLSAGLDSSAIATSAALALAPETLLAFTAAPRAGYALPVPDGRFADESDLAAATAALHPNVEHFVLRPDGADPLALAESSGRLAGQPTGHVCNNSWWTAIGRAASERGASVILTAEMGNHTISAGGPMQLADLVREGRLLRWRREASALAASGSLGWPALLAASFGPFVPAAAYRSLRRLAGRAGDGPAGADFLSHPVVRTREDERPPGDSLRFRLRLIRASDPGNFRKAALAQSGIDERDPTADRRLIEFCLSLPTEALLGGGVRRPALRRALAGRVPGAVLDEALRGYQMADWHERITASAVAAWLERMAADAAPLLDVEELRRAAERWPSEGWHRRPVIARYRMQLLRALSAAQFVQTVRRERG